VILTTADSSGPKCIRKAGLAEPIPTDISQKAVRRITIPSVSRQFSDSDFSYEEVGGSGCEERSGFLVMISHTVSSATAVTKIRGPLTCACEKIRRISKKFFCLTL